MSAGVGYLDKACKVLFAANLYHQAIVEQERCQRNVSFRNRHQSVSMQEQHSNAKRRVTQLEAEIKTLAE